MSEKRTKKSVPSRGDVNYAVIKTKLKHCFAGQVKHISTYSAIGGNRAAISSHHGMKNATTLTISEPEVAPCKKP